MATVVMRHTFASLADQGGVSLFKIGVWMGHTTSEVTEIYAHLAAYDSDINQLNGAAASHRAVTAPAEVQKEIRRVNGSLESAPSDTGS